jgi:hypothetical protein
VCSDIGSYIIISINECQKNFLVGDVHIPPIQLALIFANFQIISIPFRMGILCEDVETEVECLDTDVKEAAVIVEGLTLRYCFYAFF